MAKWENERLEELRIQCEEAGPSLAAKQAYINGLEHELEQVSARAVMWAASKGKIWAMYDNLMADYQKLKSATPAVTVEGKS